MYLFAQGLYVPGWPHTCYVSEKNRELRILLPLPSKYWVTGMDHHAFLCEFPVMELRPSFGLGRLSTNGVTSLVPELLFKKFLNFQ